MDNFYITLPSSVWNAQFDNTSSRYVTRLPEVLQLERDKYVVAVTDVIYPYSYINIGRPLNYYVHFKDSREPLQFELPVAQYNDIEHIVTSLNNKTRFKRELRPDSSELKKLGKRQKRDSVVEPPAADAESEVLQKAAELNEFEDGVSKKAEGMTEFKDGISKKAEELTDAEKEISKKAEKKSEDEKSVEKKAEGLTNFEKETSKKAEGLTDASTELAKKKNAEDEKKKAEDDKKKAEKKVEDEKKKVEDEKKKAEKKVEDEKKKAEDDKKKAEKKVEDEKKKVEDEKKKAEDDKKKVEDDKKKAEKKVEDEKKKVEDEKKKAEKKVEDEKKKAEDDKKKVEEKAEGLNRVLTESVNAMIQARQQEKIFSDTLAEYKQLSVDILAMKNSSAPDRNKYNTIKNDLEKIRSKIIVHKVTNVNDYLKFDVVNNHIKMSFTDPSVSFVEFEQACAYFLGFSDKIVDVTTIANNTVDFFGNVSTFYVYCDVVDPTIVGDQKNSLLAVVPCKGVYGEMIHHNFAQPRYLPIMSNTIDTIKIEMLSEFAEPINFNWGSTVVVLHFKKI